MFNDNSSSRRNGDNNFMGNIKSSTSSHCFSYNDNYNNNRSSVLKEFSIVQEDVIREALSDYTADDYTHDDKSS